MDEMQKIYTSSLQADKTTLQAYYTDAEELNDLMIALLGDVRGKSVLEPCVGKGAFIKPILDKAASIETVDIDQSHTDEVRSLGASNIRVQTGDFIDYFVSDDLPKSIRLSDDYNALICNPPYGLKFSVDYRKKIKKKFPSVYARESYGLFFHFGISLLLQGGRFVFIVPDTFLTSRNHAPLRRFLTQDTNLSHLVQFDSSRFETVNFGYGSMCIIAGNRSSAGQHKNMLWLDVRSKIQDINLESFEDAVECPPQVLRGQSSDGWSCLTEHVQMFNSETRLLGEIAECRTGIYTGDNSRFCGFNEDNPPKRINGHPMSWDKVRCGGGLSDKDKEFGVKDSDTYVPFIRGGHRLPFEKTASAIRWDSTAVDHYRTDKKARLQNAAFYFRSGLAVPMVTSGRLSASFFADGIFDQGVVGVFPNDLSMVDFLLVFLNSDQATALKKEINPAANNSANYIKRIGVPVPNSDQKKRAREICRQWKENVYLTSQDCREAATSFILKEFVTT